jgi:hypothetical protein
MVLILFFQVMPVLRDSQIAQHFQVAERVRRTYLTLLWGAVQNAQ